ncbi:MAG TPA: zinc ribbon domain-containing protein [Symbiobacteriaceae bacterium]|jgi:putative FmdB family regulatory protein
MPIYEYKCNTCERVFDELVPRETSGDLLKCPGCGNVGAKRLISAFAAHGLENGHIAVGRKLTGGAKSDPAPESASPSPKHSCGSGCGCGH